MKSYFREDKKMNKKNNRSGRSKEAIHTVRKDGFGSDKMYNMIMTYDAETLKTNFASRLTELRMKRNVSAREMSISLGRGAGYINSIESGHVLPSMVMLFEICDYLKVSPKEFFEFTEPEMNRLFELKLTDIYKSLGSDEKEIIRRIIELLERRDGGR